MEQHGNKAETETCSGSSRRPPRGHDQQGSGRQEADELGRQEERCDDAGARKGTAVMGSRGAGLAALEDGW